MVGYFLERDFVVRDFMVRNQLVESDLDRYFMVRYLMVGHFMEWYQLVRYLMVRPQLGQVGGDAVRPVAGSVRVSSEGRAGTSSLGTPLFSPQDLRTVLSMYLAMNPDIARKR